MACGPRAYDVGNLPAGLQLQFQGPGSLAVVWNLAPPDEPPERRLVVYAASGAIPLPIPDVREVRWLRDAALVVALELAPEAIDELPRTQLARVEVDAGNIAFLLDPGRLYDLAPAPDGALLALGAELNERGDSRLEIRDPDRGGELLVASATPFEEPRWSPDGRFLVVARMLQSTSEDDVAVSGVSLPTPRLFRLRADLFGAARLVPDGDGPGELARGGSLPLFWTAEGIYVRRFDGIARCDPDGGGCEPVAAAPESRRIVDARPHASGRALALLVDTQTSDLHPLPMEIAVVDFSTGALRVLERGPGGAWPLDLDWTPAEL